MGINPLQLPPVIEGPRIDWRSLDKIGDALAERNRFEREGEANAGLVDAVAAQGRPAMPPAPRASPAGLDYLDEIATKNGLNPEEFRRIAQIESGGRPDAQTGRYRGLFQLDPEEFAARGGKNIEDPIENASIAAARLRENKEALKRRFGREPTATELYLSHQQGIGGLSAHASAPDRPAWQSMLSTAEGRKKGEAWAKAAIWGNVPDQLKAQFGSVDNVTSGDFMKLWQGKVEALGPRTEAEAADAIGRARLSPDMAARIKALFKVGTPATQAAAMTLLQKYIGKQEPMKLGEGDVLIDPNTGQVVGRAPGKSQSVRPGGALIQDGKVVYQAPGADKGDTIEQQVAARTAQAKAQGLDPTDPNVQRYILTGQMDVKPGPGEKLEDQVATRRKVAADLGMNENDPQTRIFIATGKHPGEDRVGPTALKAIMQAEDENNTLTETVRMLRRAKELNPNIYTGFGASTRAMLGTKAKDMLVPDFIAEPGKAQATEEWQKIMEPEALQTMARTLKGATTDFELRAFIKMLADPSTTPETRGRILDRLERLATGEIKINTARMDQLRGGTYTKPGGGQSRLGTGVIPEGAILELRANPTPEMRQFFDATFGAGAAAKALGGR